MAVAFVRSHTLGTQVKASGTTVNLNISTVTGIGRLLVAYVLMDNAGTTLKPNVSTIAKAAGETNSWAKLQGAYSANTTVGNFASAEVWYIYTTVAWPVASYAVTLDTTTVMKIVGVQEFSGVLPTLRGTAGTAYSTTTTAASAATSGTAPVSGDLVVGYIFGSNVAAAQAGDTDTLGGAWSSAYSVGSTGGSGATNNFGIAQYKVTTSTSAQTLNNSAAMSAGNGAIVGVFQSNPTTPPTPSFTASASTVVAGSTLTFTDTSTGTPTSWLWNFGTGASPATATTQGPHVVTYSTVGTSNVNLTAINAGGGVAAAPTAITVTRAPISTLVDGFDSAINTPPWTVTGSVVWSAGQARFSMDTLDASGILATGYNYTLIGSSIYVKITPPAFVNNSAITFRVQDAGGEVAWIEILDAGTHYDLRTHVENVVAADIDTVTDPYTSAHQWFRVREAGGTLYLETAPDGASWTVLNSGACDADMSAVQVYFEVDAGDGLAGSYLYVDNVNVPSGAEPTVARIRSPRLSNAAIRRSSSR